MLTRRVLLFVLGAALADATCEDITDGSTVFKNPGWVKTQVDSGTITLLDARGNFTNHLRTAVHAKWQGFTVGAGSPSGGVLKDDSKLKAAFAALGVSPAKTVVVYGTWTGGWGDEGRIHWMLEFLGHPNAFIMQGGIAAYLESYPDEAIASEVSQPVPVSPSVWESGLSPQSNILILKSDLLTSIEKGALMIDTRAQGEFDGTMLKDGAPMYGVARAGHADGAVSFPFVELFDDAGCLKSCNSFKGKLESLGWTTGQELLPYCTAGIRSAFFWSFATHCGMEEVANFAGSMWEYANDDSLVMMTGDSKESSHGQVMEVSLALAMALFALRAAV